MRRRVVSLGIAVGVLAALLPLGGSAVMADKGDQSAKPKGDSGTIAGVGTITWGECTDDTLIGFGAECGTLSVPLDYSRPKGDKIQLAVSRVRHTVPDDQYQGIMLVNPGGPGGSGLIYSVLGAFVPGGAGEAYDWIGFDPRGVGASIPSLSCDPDYTAGPRPPYDPTSLRIEAKWLLKSINYAVDCAQSDARKLLGHVKTTDNVADMDAIRQALGERQLNYYGFSYGTYLGQVYATQHPERVRRMVLDSNVDPRDIWYDANLNQDVAFEAVAKLFFDWVARHDASYHLGTTAAAVEAKYYAAQSALAKQPQGQLGASEWSDAFLSAGYVQFTWPDTAAAFAAFVNDGDPGPATDLYLGQDTPGDDNGYAMYLATECSDAPWPRSWSTWRRDNTRVARTAPFLTWGNAWFNAPCAFWPTVPGTPVKVDGRKVPAILLLDETLDAATPYAGSLEVRKRFPSSSLIATVGGTNHANSLFGGVSCVDDAVAAYLADGTLPPRVNGNNKADATCDPALEPEPAAPLATQARTASSTAAMTPELRRQLQPIG